jgi:hypothetical protein
MASYKEQYYNLSEEEMQALIAKAKSGSQYAQNELLKVFNNFLTKYVSLLYYGKYNLSDYHIRRFTSLFVKDSFVRFNLMKNKLNQAGYKHVNECLRRNNLHGKKIWRRRGRSSNCQYDFLSMHC